MTSSIEKNAVRPSLPDFQTRITGLIVNRRRLSTTTGTLWLTVLKLPAKDKFSHPGTIEVRSQNPVGEINEEWSGIISISGFPRSFNSKPDQDTGEVKSVRTATNNLEVVEN